MFLINKQNINKIDYNLDDFLFTKFSEIFYKYTGIFLKEHKKYLVANRLSKYINNENGYSNFKEYYQALIDDKTGELTQKFINDLTTNFSFFFREPLHFEFLNYFLSHKVEYDDELNIWSAACSTGEEVYSIAMIIKNNLSYINSENVKILGTDISEKVLNIALEGKYDIEKTVSNLDKYHLLNYFIKNDNFYSIKPDIKKMTYFRKLNLLSEYPFKKKFNIVFLRNVMIYFDNKEKEIVINKIYEHIKKGGYLIIGLSESTIGIKHKFKNLGHSIFRKDD